NAITGHSPTTRSLPFPTPPDDQRLAAPFTRFFAPSAQNDGVKGGRTKREHRGVIIIASTTNDLRERRHIRFAATTCRAMRQHSAFPSHRDDMFVAHKNNRNPAFEGNNIDFKMLCRQILV